MLSCKQICSGGLNFNLFLRYLVAAQFVKQKLPDLLRSYVDADLGGSQEGGFQDIAIEALHLLLSHLLFGQKGSSGVGQEQIDAFLKTLCRGTQSFNPLTLHIVLSLNRVLK